jgi:hypothetical protein
MTGFTFALGVYKTPDPANFLELLDADPAYGYFVLDNGWTVGTYGAGQYALLAANLFVDAFPPYPPLSTTNTEPDHETKINNTAYGGGGPLGGGGDSLRTLSTYTGTFANAAWAFSFLSSAQDNSGTYSGGGSGDFRIRVWRDTDPTGATATEITSGAIVTTAVTFDGANHACTASWSPGSVTLAGEYLFFQIGFGVLVAGTSATLSWALLTGDIGGVLASTITTPDFGGSSSLVTAPAGVEGDTALGGVSIGIGVEVDPHDQPLSQMLGSVGHVVARVDCTVSPTGLYGTGTLGTPTIVTDSTPAVSGVVGTTHLGTIALERDGTDSPTGLYGTGTLGTPSIEVDSYPAVSGLAGTVMLGSIVAKVDAAPRAYTNPMLGEVGAVSIGIGAPSAGVYGTGQLGTPTVRVDCFVAVSGVSASSQLGSPVEHADCKVFPTGVTATGVLGLAVGNSSSPAPLGVVGYGQVGVVKVVIQSRYEKDRLIYTQSPRGPI